MYGWRDRAGVVMVVCLVAACGDRRDAADLAVGVAPFDQLRGVNVAQLRSGGVRAFRRAAQPAPFEGLREPIGAFDVLFAVPGFDGSDGSWPSEDALVSHIEATREWPSDTLALGAWRGAITALQGGLGVAPECYTLTGPGFTVRMAEWQEDDGWSVSATYAPAIVSGSDTTLSARHSLAVRREAITVRFPQVGTPNPDERPIWAPISCSPTSASAVPSGTS